MEQIGTGQKVVIVEDNVALAEVYKTRLDLLGYQTIVANDGIDAVSIIKRELPALVLLDLMVPKIAGDQILEIMRGSDWGKHIKVLIISNLNEADAPAGLRDKGIEGYVVKANLSDDALDKLVDSILKPSGQTESVDLETPSETMAPAAAPPQPPAPLSPPANFDPVPPPPADVAAAPAPPDVAFASPTELPAPTSDATMPPPVPPPPVTPPEPPTAPAPEPPHYG